MSEDIKVTDGTILEALNNKVDLDGGNYKGSELEAYIHEHCGGSGGSGFNLFDTKISDHILEGEEAEGWALQGTYVYKEPIAGLREGYPDFYNKVIEEFNQCEASENLWFPYTQPKATGETTVIDGKNLVITSSNNTPYGNNDRAAWQIMDGNKDTHWAYQAGNSYAWIKVQLPEKVKIKNISLYMQVLSKDAGGGIKTLRLYTDETKTTPIGDTISCVNGTVEQTVSPNNIPADGIITDCIYVDITECYTNQHTGNAMVLSEITITAEKSRSISYEHPNGHMFYDIVTKDSIDELYENTGEAWYYGIDTENERIFLPRTEEDETKHLYICVGNTKVTQAATNVTEITTSENDTLPWGYSFYSGDLLEAPIGYVKSQGQYESGEVYSSFYNKALKKIGEPFAKGYIRNYTEAFTDYDLVVNEDNITFRLPLLDGSEDFPSNKKESITFNGHGTSYIAPANGFYTLTGWSSSGGNGADIWIKNATSGAAQYMEPNTDAGSSVCVTVFASKGDTVQAGGYKCTITSLEFSYAKGNGDLYFKVANAVQNLELLDAGEVLEAVSQVSSKVDTSIKIVETYQNEYSWYRIWSDGWIEQGGWTYPSGAGTGDFTSTITLLKPYTNTYYSITMGTHSGYAGSTTTLQIIPLDTKYTTGFTIKYHNTDLKNTNGVYWVAQGY